MDSSEERAENFEKIKTKKREKVKAIKYIGVKMNRCWWSVTLEEPSWSVDNQKQPSTSP